MAIADYKKAHEAERDGDFDSALGLWVELSLQTGTPEAYCQLARIAFMLGKWQVAETALLRALELNDNFPTAVAMLGALFLDRTDGERLSNMESAKMWLLRSAEISKTAPIMCLLGVVYSRLKEKDRALQAWQEAIKLDARCEEAYYNLGILALDKGNMDQAEDFFRKSLHIDPGFLRAHAHLGRLMLKQGRRLEADNEFRRCIEIDPNDRAANLYFGAGGPGLNKGSKPS